MARSKNSESAKPATASTAPEIPDGQQIEAAADQPAEKPKTAAQPKPTPTKRTEPTADLSPGDRTTQVEDTDTDRAVDDIAAREADTMLAVQDALGRKHSQPPAKPGWRTKLKRLLKSKKTWAVVAVVLLVLFALPVTRYKIIGLFIKKPISVVVLDSRTHTPVSDATVSAHGHSAKTNADGRAVFKTAPGGTRLEVSKQYYKTADQPIFIGLRSSGTKAKVQLVAIGRQVPLTVLNKITGQPLANVQVSALKTSVKTNARGQAVMVLPAATATDKGSVQLKGYNTAAVTIQVTNNAVSGNVFQLTPAGHIYFLSNLSGKLDVIQANLDGSGHQTVLPAAGNEDSTAISLLATRDWQYAVLKSRRDTAQPALYLINASNNKVTPFDTNNSNFKLIGWFGHNFMYDAISNTTPQAQNGHEAIKSYDADHQQLNQLDQSQAETSAGGYAYQEFYNFYVLNNQLVYNTQWYSGGADLNGKNATIRGVQPNGQNKKDYQAYSSAGLNYVLAALYQPQAIYYDAYNGAAGQTTYYNFANQTVNAVSLDQSYFRKTYPTYLLSPSGNQTFWADQSNGQNTLFVGDANGQHGRALAGLGDYQPYGWYSDNYLLLSKGGSELYIMPASGLRAGRQPYKIGYYYKPVTSYPNYGYGYGGL